MTGPLPEVLCIGVANVDVIAHVDTGFLLKHRIDKGTSTLTRSVDLAKLIGELANPLIIPGGCAANTACGVAMAGIDTAFVGMVSGDSYGRIFTDGFAPYGVRFLGAKHAEKHTSLCVTLVTQDKDRSFVFSPDAASWFLSDTMLPAPQPGKPIIVYAEANLLRMTAGTRQKTMLHAVIEKYRDPAATIILNLNDTEITTRQRGIILDFVESGDLAYIVSNCDELRALFDTDNDEDAFYAARRSGQTFVTTLGRDGCALISEDAIIRTPALFIPHEDIVDMIGAGDQFAAGFITGLASGKTPREACATGIKFATGILEVAGARPRTERKRHGT